MPDTRHDTLFARPIKAALMTLPFCLPVLMSAILLPLSFIHLHFFKKVLTTLFPVWMPGVSYVEIVFPPSGNSVLVISSFFYRSL